MASLMTKEEFLKELSKRKAELKLKLSRIAEAKSDFEITDFRLSNARDEYMLESSSLIQELGSYGPKYPALVMFLGLSFPYFIAHGNKTEGSFYIASNSGGNLLKALEYNKNELAINLETSYEAFIEKIYQQAKNHFFQMKAYVRDSEMTGGQMANHTLFERVLWTSRPNDPARINELYKHLEQLVQTDEFFDNILVTFEEYIQQTGPKLFSLCQWMAKNKEAEGRIASEQEAFASFSDYLKTFLENCSKDPDLKDLVPSYEQMLADAEKPEESIAMPQVMPQSQVQALEGKNKSWMYLAGAAAVYYLLS